jgi:hypothetical protein
MQGGWLTDWLSSLSLTGLVLFILVTMLLAAFAGHGVHRLARRWAQASAEEEVRQHHRRSEPAYFRQYQGIAGGHAHVAAVPSLTTASGLRPVRCPTPYCGEFERCALS